MPRKYPPEFRQRAVRLLVEALPVHESEYEAIRHVVGKLEVSAEALRRWRCRLTTGRRSPSAESSANEARFPPTQDDRLRQRQPP